MQLAYLFAFYDPRQLTLIIPPCFYPRFSVRAGGLLNQARAPAPSQDSTVGACLEPYGSPRGKEGNPVVEHQDTQRPRVLL